MDKQFTASEVREMACAAQWEYKQECGRMLHAYADMLEAQEKAVPVAWWNKRTGQILRPHELDAIPDAPHPHSYFEKGFVPLTAHSAQTQPTAASVPEVSELTWEPPNVSVDVERVGRFRSGDEHIVRVTFRSSDDGRRMTCFYAANESAVGYLHAMLAAQKNPND